MLRVSGDHPWGLRRAVPTADHQSEEMLRYGPVVVTARVWLHSITVARKRRHRLSTGEHPSIRLYEVCLLGRSDWHEEHQEEKDEQVQG